MSKTSHEQGGVWRFGLYELDPRTAKLSKQGNQIKLQEQPFRILLLLVERAGEMVSREELRSLLWPDGTYVEFDGSLNTALMKLRAALNDEPDNPRFIETVPRKGYRFIAPVSAPENRANSIGEDPFETAEAVRAESEAISETRQTAAAPGKRLFASTVPVRLIAVFGFLFVGVLVVGILWRIWPRGEARVLLVTQLTHTGKIVPGSKIITDGTRIYFMAEQDGQIRLMQSSIRGGSVEKLTTPFESTFIFDISPDHSQFLIGPSARGGEPVPVWVWPAHGGAPHRLGDVSAQEAAWSPAGDQIAFAKEHKLFTVRPDGADIREIGSFTSIPHSLIWSPQGRHLRFTQTDLEKGTDEIWEIASDAGGLRRLFENPGTELHEGSGAWAGDGRYFLFVAGSDSHLNLAVDTLSNVWAIREKRGFTGTGRAPAQVTYGPVSYTQLSALQGGKRIFALGSHPQYQLMRFDANTGKSVRILEDAGATDVDYSPDGEWIVYALRQNGTLWKSRKDGNGRLELTSTSPGAYAPSWSPNGKAILFTAFLLGKRPQLYIVPSGGGVPQPVLPPGTSGVTLSGDWSPDGSRIVMDYTNHEKNLPSELQVLDLSTGAIVKLPKTEGLSQPRWSPDGKHLAAVENRTHRILFSDGLGEAWTFLADAVNPSSIHWSEDGKTLYFQDGGDSEKSVFRVRMDNRSKEKILGFRPWLVNGAAQCHFTGVGPDGSIYATIDHGGTDLYALDLSLP